MAASTNDKFIKTGASTVTTLSAPGKALSATSITVGSTTNYPTDTGIVFAIRQVDVNGDLVAGTYTEWIGTVTSATTLSLLATPVYGSDQVYPAGSTTQVFIPLSSYAHNRMVDGLAVSLDQDGTLKAGAVDNPAVLATDVVETAKIADANITTPKLATGAVTPEKLSTTPIGFGFQEIARTTLSSTSDTITVSSIPAKKHLRIIISTVATGGTLDTTLKFNNDASAIYRMQYNTSAAISTSVDTGVTTNLPLESGATASGGTVLSVVDMTNNSTSSKTGLINTSNDGGGAMVWLRGAFKYVTNTQVTRVDIINTGTGDFAVGSEVIILGTD